ncbi:MAG: Gldg family protein [Lachnospiraceae bacterium]|nr:Gldg family protein [Lachnospiraceae bacterium]
MIAVLKKELKIYMTSLSTYVYYVFFFLMTGIFFVNSCLKTGNTTFGYYVLRRSFLAAIIFIPIFTVHIYSKEKKAHTDQLLLTAPVLSWKIIIAKYVATMLVTELPLFLSMVYPFSISAYGILNIRFTAASYIACILIAMLLISLATFFSSIISHPVLAIIVTYSGITVFWRVGLMHNIPESISVYGIYNDMISGIIRSGDVLYLLLLSVVLLLSSCILTEGRQTRRFLMSGIKVCILLVVVSGIIVIGMYYTKVYDFTAEELLTLSDETKQVLEQVKKPTSLYYIGTKSRVNATYQELLAVYSDLNENIEIIYKDVEEDPDFCDEYLGDIDNINETSILVVSEDRQIYLDAADYISSTYVSSYSVKSYLEIENQLTKAIYYVNSDQSEKIMFVEGNGEEILADRFTKLLKMDNYDIDTCNIEEAANLTQESFADKSKIAVINAPKIDYSESAIHVLEDYLEKGGNLVITLDPLNEELSNLYEFLENYGLSVQPGVVIEQEQGRYVNDTSYYLAPDIKDSVYTTEIKKQKAGLLTMTSKGIKTVEPQNGYQVTEVLKTSTQAFSKVGDFDKITSKGEEDIQGPFAIAAVAEKEGEGSLFLVSSNLFLHSDVDIESNSGNRKFFFQVVNILTKHQDGIMIEGKEVDNQKAFYPTQSRTLVACLVIVVIPVVIIGIGILVLFIRYRVKI